MCSPGVVLEEHAYDPQLEFIESISGTLVEKVEKMLQVLPQAIADRPFRVSSTFAKSLHPTSQVIVTEMSSQSITYLLNKHNFTRVYDLPSTPEDRGNESFNTLSKVVPVRPLIEPQARLHKEEL